jgi:hypothetical protein
VSTELAAVRQPGRAPTASACEPYRELIERALERGRNAMAIWQDLVDMHGFPARYSSVRRFVQTLHRTAPEPHAVRHPHAGENDGAAERGPSRRRRHRRGLRSHSSP